MSIADEINSMPAKVKKVNPWLDHVADFWGANKEMTYKEALKQAGATYKRVEKSTVKQEKKENPWMLHISNWKSANPDWKKTYSYKQVLVLCKETYKSPIESK